MLASRSAYFSAWRRWTRPLTAVAVPATTAVRATPRSNPGIGSSSSVGRFSGFEHFHDGIGGDAGRSHDLGTDGAGGLHERDGPRVLVDDERGHGAGLEGVARLVHVVLAEEAGTGALEHGEAAEVIG